MLLKSAPKLGDALSLCIECADCGFTRWRRVSDFYCFGYTAEMPIERLTKALFCTPCRNDGLPGKNIAVEVAFLTLDAQRKAEAWAATRSQKARAAG